MIHPDDLDKIREFRIHGKLVSLEKIAGNYSVINCDGERFRVSLERFQSLPAPRYLYGQEVTAGEKLIRGIVRQIGWHHKRGEHTYYISVEGKPKKTRYFECDLQLIK